MRFRGRLVHCWAARPHAFGGIDVGPSRTRSAIGSRCDILQPFQPSPYDFAARARSVLSLLILTLLPGMATAFGVGKTFDHKAAEERWFQLWVDRGYFKADPARPGEVFSIVIPPPNVTGALHLGSAFNNVLQDVIVRTRRMQGYNTLWIPGTDHAGIATQNVVEREIAKEGKSRHDLGRTLFVERVWEWRNSYGSRILYQLRRLGASCDWSRERFTLDAGLSRAVIEVFVRLHREGLIYRDRRLINWCPRCETALSDLEVDHKDADGNLYYIHYPFADGPV